MVQTSEQAKQAFAERLREALRNAGIRDWGSGQKLAKMCEVSPRAAIKWLNGDSIPGHEKIMTLSERLQVREEWLAYGRGPMELSKVSDTSAAYEATPAGDGQTAPNTRPADQPASYYRYPVIGYGQAGGWTECVIPYAPGAEPHLEATDYQAKGHAFWLEIKGDSMTAPPGATPTIPEGTLVLIDPGVEAAPGKLVVAQVDDSNEATFKKLVEDGGQRFLKALNPAYPVIAINGNCRIVGVAVEAKTRL
ncbi:LexA family transcriptional regulator [Chromohalobacter moromii]|nr:XRE family transcriptional regulator [Chromohalobacter moromii]